MIVLGLSQDGTLKGLSHEMNSAFDDVWLVLGLNRGLGHSLNFLGVQRFYNSRSVFLAVNASLR